LKSVAGILSAYAAPDLEADSLRIGYSEEWSVSPTPDQKDAPTIDCRFAEVEYLQELGMGRTAFKVYLGEKPASEAIGFDHEFDPAARVPGPIF